METSDDDGNMGTPEEVGALYEQFRAGTRPRPPTPEEEAALGLAVEISSAETRAFIEANRMTAMAAEFPDELRETVLHDLSLAMALADGLHQTWCHGSEPADLLASARGLRDAASALAKTVESLWSGHPPPDYTRELFGDS